MVRVPHNRRPLRYHSCFSICHWLPNGKFGSGQFLESDFGFLYFSYSHPNIGRVAEKREAEMLLGMGMGMGMGVCLGHHRDGHLHRPPLLNLHVFDRIP